MSEQEQMQNMSEEEALRTLAGLMKDNSPNSDEKHNVHTFLFNVVTATDSRKIGNLLDNKDLNELGIPSHHVRGCLEMARISDKIMDNDFFKEWFLSEAEETLSTSLSRNGFLVKQATTQTKQVADITRRTKIHRSWLGREKKEEQGGDTTGSSSLN